MLKFLIVFNPFVLASVLIIAVIAILFKLQQKRQK